jgi:AcrR family transcriptional regulator
MPSQIERRAEAERKLLEAAMELVAERGVRAVTLAAVGERAGYSRGLVTHHFGNRQGLLDALTLELQTQFHARVFLVLWAEAIAAETDLRPAFNERDARFRATLVECLEEGLADGEIRPDLDPAAVAHALVGQLRGTSLQLMSTQDVDLDPVVREVHALLERGLRP